MLFSFVVSNIKDSVVLMHKRFSLFLVLILQILYIECIKCNAIDFASEEKILKIPAVDKIKEFTIRENDTLTYTLKLALDEKGKPQYFFRNIFTPVCYTGECKPVYINFYWDLLGNYMRYDLPDGKILTKVDHDEFKEEDYEKLRDILGRSTSIFADLKMEDLMTKGTDSLSANVDAKTGATLKTIKNEVIDGAVYTCFTLWHIAYGKLVINKMREVTESYLNDEMLHSFLSSNNYHYQYWAMDRVIDKNGALKNDYEKDIEQIIRGKNLFTARTALQKTGNDFFASLQKQNWLWETYKSSSYPLQITILKKLGSISPGEKLSNQLASNITESNTEQFRLKIGILAKQQQLPESTQKIMATALSGENEQYTSEIYKTLEYFRPTDNDVKSKMEQYKSRKSN